MKIHVTSGISADALELSVFDAVLEVTGMDRSFYARTNVYQASDWHNKPHLIKV